MFNLIREADYKIERLKKYVECKVYDSFYDLNNNYKSGMIYAGVDWQSKYFIDKKYQENILNFDLIDFAKNKYRTYKVAEELGIPTLKTIMINNPCYASWKNDNDLREVFGKEKFVAKPNDSGTAKRLFKINVDELKDVCEKELWDEYVLCQEFIKGDYQDIRVVIVEPFGIVDSFSRLPANVIDCPRDYESRVDIKVEGQLLDYVNRYRKWIWNNNLDSKYMFYSIDFYKTDKGLIFGEINNNIGIHLVNDFCMEKIKECLDVGREETRYKCKCHNKRDCYNQERYLGNNDTIIKDKTVCEKCKFSTDIKELK